MRLSNSQDVSFGITRLILTQTPPGPQNEAAGELEAQLGVTRYCHDPYCMVHCIEKGGRRGVAYCAMVVQSYCNRVGFAGRGSNRRMMDSHTKALK